MGSVRIVTGMEMLGLRVPCPEMYVVILESQLKIPSVCKSRGVRCVH